MNRIGDNVVQIVSCRADGEKEKGEHDDEEHRGGELRLEDTVRQSEVVYLVSIVTVVHYAGKLTLKANVMEACHFPTL